MIKTILVTTDGSTIARNAAGIGFQIASAEQAHIKCLYVVDETLILDTYANYSKELGQDTTFASRSDLIESFRSRGEEAMSEIQTIGDRWHAHLDSEVLFGGVPELILSAAADTQLITIGRRGNKHLSDREHIGNNFRHIAHHTGIPLVVGGDTCPKIERIFLVYDEKRNSQSALEWALHLNKTLDAKIIIGWIPKDGDRRDSPQFRERLDASGMSDYTLIYLDMDYKNIISAVSQEKKADLIITKGYHNPEFIDLLRGNPSDELLSKCALPILLT
jgi:nucleotide-binding universal stress UspA family protein